MRTWSVGVERKFARRWLGVEVAGYTSQRARFRLVEMTLALSWLSVRLQGRKRTWNVDLSLDPLESSSAKWWIKQWEKDSQDRLVTSTRSAATLVGLLRAKKSRHVAQILPLSYNSSNLGIVWSWGGYQYLASGTISGSGIYVADGGGSGSYVARRGRWGRRGPGRG